MTAPQKRPLCIYRRSRVPLIPQKPQLKLLMMANSITRATIILWSCLYALCYSYSCLADVGTATSYYPPYAPSKCYGNDQQQFPPGNLFAAASESIWDNGTACGRQYSVRCLRGTNQTSENRCLKNTDSIVVKIVDYCSSDCNATIQLSTDAFMEIASSVADVINIEYDKTYEILDSAPSCEGHTPDHRCAQPRPSNKETPPEQN